MTLHYEDAGLRLWHGSNKNILPTFEDASFDSIVTDPPYELGFMGKGWDSTGVAFDVDVWRECLRVLKPGGHLLAFGGSRTWHRMAVAIEDAGFEIRDSIAWLYGEGFPKSMDVSKAIDKTLGAEREVTRPAARSPLDSGSTVGFDQRISIERERRDEPATEAARAWKGWGTALKPAFEPIIVARKPLSGTVAANVLAHGTGALHIDACRIPGQWSTWQVQQEKPLAPNTPATASVGWGNGYVGEQHPGGRHPANLVLDESQAQRLDDEVGILKSGALKPYQENHENASSYRINRDRGKTYESPANEGGPSRFFPTFRYEGKARRSERPEVDGAQHATVKPLELMRWLIRLVTRPGGRVLDLYAGSGTTGEAALLEGMEVDLIEIEADHLPLILQRIRKPLQPSMFGDWEGGAA